MAVWKRGVLLAEEALAETLAGPPVQGNRRLLWETKTGAWLTVQPFTVNGMKLCVQEWLDSLFL